MRTAPSRSPPRRCASRCRACQSSPSCRRRCCSSRLRTANIELVDNDGRSMFPEGAKEPYERARHLIQKLAGQIKLLPYRITVTGHTSATRLPSRPGYGAWEMSADRANSVRQILEQEGVPTNNMFMVAGKADTAPLFPDDPYIAANRRITITLMRGQPPLPPGFKP